MHHPRWPTRWTVCSGCQRCPAASSAQAASRLRDRTASSTPSTTETRSAERATRRLVRWGQRDARLTSHDSPGYLSSSLPAEQFGSRCGFADEALLASWPPRVRLEWQCGSHEHAWAPPLAKSAAPRPALLPPSSPHPPYHRMRRCAKGSTSGLPGRLRRSPERGYGDGYFWLQTLANVIQRQVPVADTEMSDTVDIPVRHGPHEGADASQAAAHG